MAEERLQKFLSRAGVSSRRASEKFIVAGRVRVNGQVVHDLGVKVDPEKDKVWVDGKLVEAGDQKIYLAMYKPSGYVTSRQDEFGRPTVFDLLPKSLKNSVWNVGRLDFETEGLLVFTNDGDLTQVLTHPSFEHEKEYEVKLSRNFDPVDAKPLEQGMEIEDYVTAPAKVSQSGGRTLKIVIHEGRKRQIRKMFDALGYGVISLTRVRVGDLTLADLGLQPAQVIDVERDDIIKRSKS